ncbi:G-type lectin S-receptor-like serine/threonine-protein kinase [Forsythia ovata]|uniref:Receptor-like serine/threonine-protein kinase n=1 Tax=Forsythia ovata TaxID=205694 RepID=A0ABD1Q8W2_9LAMI
MDSLSSICLHILLLSLLLQFCIAVDTLTSNAAITNGETLVSSGESFELGFFSPSNSSKWYVGIWYKKFPEIFVWVANRESPLENSSGVLTISPDGDLILLNGTRGVVWSSNSSGRVQGSVAQLLESGNLVLQRKDNNTQTYLWQSFDFPSDTLLPGMKMGWNLSAGINRYLTSWKDDTDPSPGDITYRIDNLGMPQFVLRKGSEKIFRTGPWNGIRFSGIRTVSNTVFKPVFIYDNEEYMYEFTDNSFITRLIVTPSGLVRRLALNKGDSSWTTLHSSQNDQCDDYGRCGANGICKISNRQFCECLHGFVPKSQSEWGILDWSSGCVRRIPLNCQRGEGFVKLRSVKLPDLLQFSLNKSMSLKQCESECLKNCYCIAYANSDIRKGGSGCFMWFGDLIDIREFSENNEQDVIYIRMPALEVRQSKKTRLVLILVISSVSGVLILGFLIWCLTQNSRRKRGFETKDEDIDLPMFNLVTITTATENFSVTNIIGEGGFGIVYKGTLSTGQEVAVKRLSKNSGQGLQEFKNEVTLIAKLQHRNLVRLLGYQHRKALLSWQKRFDIVMGISRGILYLHLDSRLRIIHRDLKTSNILLDSNLNPKISDFGLARIFGEDQTESKTKQVVGTYGYMSPDYVVDGKFSVKSDVFSFGVLLLEIVSGKKNRTFQHPDHHHNLVGHAWLLWREGRARELADNFYELSLIESEVLKCIHIGLLCVQKLPEDRPTMASVVVMLSNEGVTLPQPKEPGFFTERSCTATDASTSEERCLTHNVVTITVLEAR